MRILEDFVRIFAPHTCLGCGVEEDVLLCEGCAESLARVPSRCYRCKAVSEDYEVCRDCRSHTSLRQVVVYTHHTDLAKELVHRMKYERAQAGIREAAGLMSRLVDSLPSDVLLTPVPTATTRVRQRGYDHARVLCRTLVQQTGLESAVLLGRVGQAHQVGAGRTARLKQLERAFRPVHPQRLKDKHVVLVDDVLTTGATLEMAARTLKRAGAKQVSALVFAQA